jgi:branched-chain amino acid aminotransferase
LLEVELVTPPLDGPILEGVTRQSLIDLGNQWGKFKVSERPITMKETLDHLNNNRVIIYEH